MRYFWRVLIGGHATSGSGDAPRAVGGRTLGWRGIDAACPWIECRAANDGQRPSHAILRGPLRRFRERCSLVALGGCAVKHPTADLVNGKQLFVAKCGSCHTLAHAAHQGTVGPNLDDAFRQDRADGVKSTSIQGLVDYWIQYPNTQGVMPAKLVKGQDAQDVAAYVAQVAAIPARTPAAGRPRSQSVKQKPRREERRSSQINADPDGPAEVPGLERAARPPGKRHAANEEHVLGRRTTSRSGAAGSARSARSSPTAGSRR